MEKWLVAQKKADFDRWAREFQIDPVLARILRNRELLEDGEVRRFLYGDLQDCYSPWLLKDMEPAVEYLIRALLEKKRIRVIGDYDVDGICSSYILTRGLENLGAGVDTAIPHRIHDGYGLNDNLIREAKEDGVELILTCDNGIAAREQIALAKELGVDVIVTDHHEVPYVCEGEKRRELLPEALAVVDPKREGDTYPFPGICGGVVAYKLMQAVLQRLDKPGVGGSSEGSGSSGKDCLAGGGTVEKEGENAESSKDLLKRREALRDAMEEFLEFAAFATVCDVMELRGENRILVKEGLKRLRNSRNLGLRALMEVNGISGETLSAYHLGFVLGPCLNATGRLDTAKTALELLQSRDKRSALEAAGELKRLNDSRKNLTLQGVELANRLIREKHMETDKVLVLFLPEVHESLAGIIAGRIREQYFRPVIVLTRAEEGIKGSGRSIEAYHMYEALTEVKHFFTKFGGHKMAAGLSMKEEDVDAFREALNGSCRLREEDFVPTVHIDVPMPVSYATEELAHQMELLEPFGVGNPKPLFAEKDLLFLDGVRMGRERQFARFRVQDIYGNRIWMVYFGEADNFAEFLDEKYGAGSGDALFSGQGQFSVSVVYQISLNHYKGKTELQFLMQNYR